MCIALYANSLTARQATNDKTLFGNVSDTPPAFYPQCIPYSIMPALGTRFTSTKLLIRFATALYSHIQHSARHLLFSRSPFVNLVLTKSRTCPALLKSRAQRRPTLGSTNTLSHIRTWCRAQSGDAAAARRTRATTSRSDVTGVDTFGVSIVAVERLVEWVGTS